MPIYRKRRARKRPVRKRRFVRKKRMVRKLKSMNNQINIKQRSTDAITVTTPQLERTAPVTMETFSLNSVPRKADFKAMFDKFKINGVRINFQIEGDTSTWNTQGLTMVYRIDKDGRSIWDKASVGTMLGSNNTRVINFSQNRTSASIFLKPKTVSPVYTGNAASPGWKENKAQWLDTNSPSILHYGLEYGWMNSTSTLNIPVKVQITYTYYLSFKGIITTYEPPAAAIVREQYLPATEDLSGNPLQSSNNSEQIAALQQQIDQLLHAHDSDNDHDPSGNVSHPDAAYY